MRGSGPDRTSLFDLIRLAYHAGADPSQWPAFLERYRQAMHGSCVSIHYWNRRVGNSPVVVAAGPVADEAMRQYNAHWGAFNPHFRHKTWQMRPGAITLSHLSYPVEDLLKTEYYNDYCGKLDLGAVIGACLDERDGVYTHISSLRPLRLGLYGDEETQFLRPLVPHLQRAMQIHRHLEGLRLDRLSEAGALDLLTGGVLVVSAASHVLLMNRRAEQLLAARDGLTLTGDGLRAAGTADTAALRALIAQAASGARGESLHAGGFLRISRPSLRRPLMLLVAPKPLPLAYPVLPADSVTLVVRDPEHTTGSRALLTTRYGLTPTEEKLAEHILAGGTVESCCEPLAITRETARTHLKSVLRKSSTKRQAEFVRAVTMSLVGHIHRTGREENVDV